MTLRVAQFFLKIAHLSFSMGPRGPRAYGLHPRLWLLATSVFFSLAMSEAYYAPDYVKNSVLAISYYLMVIF